MPDIALHAEASPVTRMPLFDIGLTPIPDGAEDVARDVDLDYGIDTSVYLSLFTDARGDPETARDPNDLRGWWGDNYGTPIGSRLWELTYGKATDEAVSNAGIWAEDALRWMVDAGIALSVTAEAMRIGLYAISIVVQIQRPGRSDSSFRYDLNWAMT